jgi:beta-N-acetylhexosaminidase
MSLGPLILGIDGTELTGSERRRLEHPAVGGVVLFTRNYESPEQLSALTAEIRSLRRPPLLICVDQEGGRVQRFRTGFTDLPPPSTLGRLYDREPTQALEAAESVGWLMAAELRARGVDFSFAPVVDLDRGISKVIGDRALHRDPTVVSRLAIAWCRGARGAGMASVAKHFPGHGGCAPDSHFERPVDERPLVDIEAEDLVPFRRLADNGLEGVMAAHIVFPAVDHCAAGYSRRWLRQLLRQRLGFEGAIFSDDLGMEGAMERADLSDRIRASLEAGCDAVLICNEPAAVDPLLNELTMDGPATKLRLARLHGRGTITPEQLNRDSRRARARTWIERLEEGLTGELDV